MHKGKIFPKSMCLYIMNMSLKKGIYFSSLFSTSLLFYCFEEEHTEHKQQNVRMFFCYFSIVFLKTSKLIALLISGLTFLSLSNSCGGT